MRSSNRSFTASTLRPTGAGTNSVAALSPLRGSLAWQFPLVIEDVCEDVWPTEMFTLPPSRAVDERQWDRANCPAPHGQASRVAMGARDIDADDPGRGDLYANLLWPDGRKCILLTHAGTLFPVFVAECARELRPLVPWLVVTIGRELAAEGLPPGARSDDVGLAKTARCHVWAWRHG